MVIREREMREKREKNARTEYDLEQEGYRTDAPGRRHPGVRGKTMRRSDDEYSLEDEDEPSSEDGYVIEEEEETRGGDKVCGMESSGNDSESGLGGDTDEDPEKKPSALRLLFDMMFGPTEGWKKIRRARFTPEEVARNLLYPLTALASVSVFAEYIYGSNEPLNATLIKALTVFISFFFGYFLILLMERVIFPKHVVESTTSDYGKIFTMYLLSTLTLFFVVASLIPMLEAVWDFLPLWTIFAASKGTRYFHFPDNRKTMMTVIVSVLSVLSPVAIYMLFIELIMM